MLGYNVMVMINDSIKTIVCYGDSNTWGNVPNSDLRYPHGVRWPSALQNILGSEYEVISEGLCGRTLKSNIASPEKNGINYILPCILSHEPTEWLIIMLGTNDVKDKYKLSTDQIAQNLKETISIVRGAEIENRESLKILVICPPKIIVPKSGSNEQFKEGIEKSEQLTSLYKMVAQETNSFFLDAGIFTQSSDIDGVHLDELGHLELARVVANIILAK